jgi:A/G-specific adenine glycosylase
MVARHAGEVPASADALRALPGIGAYTAAAVASFAFGQRHAVLDTNVRRVLARLVSGQQHPAPGTSAAEVTLAESLLPADGRLAARWSVALMELGALVCTAARPSCASCPVAAQCRWRRDGSPPGRPRRRQPGYPGSDRHCRGTIMAALRAADGPLPAAALAPAWHEEGQRARVLAALLADGLICRTPDGAVSLPGDPPG